MHYWWVCRKLKLYFFSSTTANHKWPVNLSIIIDDHTKERVELYSVKKLSLRQSELRASRNHESSYQLCVACKNVSGYDRFPAKSLEQESSLIIVSSFAHVVDFKWNFGKLLVVVDFMTSWFLGSQIIFWSSKINFQLSVTTWMPVANVNSLACCHTYKLKLFLDLWKPFSHSWSAKMRITKQKN